jgi:hypothetical protein
MPSDFNERLAFDALTGRLEKNQARRKLQRRAAAQSGAHGQIRIRQKIEALRCLQPEDRQRGDHTERIIKPRILSRLLLRSTDGEFADPA